MSSFLGLFGFLMGFLLPVGREGRMSFLAFQGFPFQFDHWEVPCLFCLGILFYEELFVDFDVYILLSLAGLSSARPEEQRKLFVYASVISRTFKCKA